MSTDLSVVEPEQPQRGGQMIAVAESRQAQEVQAMILLAKKFPRDEDEAIRKITTACKRTKLAEVSMYQYARGGQDITGPSIRLAECLALAWGNLEHGVKELSQANGESVVEAYAWDLETNSRSSKVFTVKHIRSTKKGTYALTDPRDIYELVANSGARRVRACILSVIPKDVQDAAVEQCTKTLTEGNTEPLVDRVRKMFAAFEAFGVTPAMIEARAQRKSESFTEQNILDLRKVYMSLKDGMSAAEEWFEFAAPEGVVKDEPVGESKAAKTAKSLKKEKTPAPVEKKEEPVAEPTPETSPVGDVLEAFTKQLAECKDEGAVRDCWSLNIFDRKDQLAPQTYLAGCKMRDTRIAEVKTK